MIFLKFPPYMRKQEILEILRKQDYIDLSELSKTFQVSYMTIHRDVQTLVNQGKVERVHGGIVSAKPHPPQQDAPSKQTMALPDLTMEERFTMSQPAKIAIVKKAAAMVQDGDIIALDASTTAIQMCHYLLDKKITVVTNGIGCLLCLSESETVEVVVRGGILRKSALSTQGFYQQTCINQINIQKFFFSATAISASRGMTEMSLDEAHVKEELLAHSRQHIALVDSSKLGEIAPYAGCPLSEIHTVITDCVSTSEPPKAACLASFAERGIQVILA